MNSTLFAIDLPVTREHARTIARAHYVQKLASVLGNGADWDYRGECLDLQWPTGKCSCGHHGLRYLFTLHHKTTGATTIVGSTCITTYPGISQGLADRLNSKVERLEDLARKRAARAAYNRQAGPPRLLEAMESGQP